MLFVILLAYTDV